MKSLKEFNQWLEEEEKTQRTSFSLEELKKISAGKASEQGLKAVHNYIASSLGKPLHYDSSRAVWAVNDTEVLKVGLLFQELDQNKREAKNMKCLGNTFAPNLLGFDPNFYWLLMEHVNPISTPTQFVELFGKQVGMELKPQMKIDGINSNVAMLLVNLIGGFQTKTYKTFLNSLLQIPWFKELMTGIKKCKIDPGDLNYNNWGTRPGSGSLVILDLGF